MRMCDVFMTRGRGWRQCGSGRGWWNGVGIGFKDNSLLSVVGPPFIEYDVARFYKLVRQSMHQTKSGSLLGEAEEGAGNGMGGQLVARFLRDMCVSHAAEHAEL